MRVQVTDLAITTADEGQGVTFVVTSLKAPPRSPAPRSCSKAPRGRAAAGSSAPWRRAPPTATAASTGQRRATKAAARPPSSGSWCAPATTCWRSPRLFLDTYHDGSWSPSYAPWLAWAFQAARAARPAAAFPRPHLPRAAGLPAGGQGPPQGLPAPEAGRPARALAAGRRGGGRRPGRAALAAAGRGRRVRQLLRGLRGGGHPERHLYRLLPGGRRRSTSYGRATFRKEAYKLPKFDVVLTGPATAEATLDREFKVQLTATYYAGGRVAQRPIAWRVTQYPYAFQPRERPGFLFSSDGRFSRTERFRSTPDPRKGRGHRRQRRQRLVAQPGDRADRAAAHLRGGSDGHRRRRRHRHQHPADQRVAALRPGHEGAAFPRGRARSSSPRSWCSARPTSRSPARS